MFPDRVPAFKPGDVVQYWYRGPNHPKEFYTVVAVDGDSVWLRPKGNEAHRGYVERALTLRWVPPTPPDIINYYVMFGGLSERFITSFDAEDRYLHTPTTGPKMLVKINLTQGTVDILRSKP